MQAIDIVVGLDDPEAVDPRRVGGKASALALVRRAGLSTLPGSVFTTELSESIDRGESIDDEVIMRRALELAACTDRPAIVRSSSVVEDQTQSSMAGQFESVLDVSGVDALREAVGVVVASRHRAGAADQPIAVLVQAMIEPETAGVYFGVDPVSGRTDRRVVAVVNGLPDKLVLGSVTGTRYVIDLHGNIIESDVRDGATLTRAQIRALDHLGHRLAMALGGPQDVEWAIVDGELLVLQSRPVTTEVRGVPTGPTYGPGPVAETFPEPLTRLELDLWVPPLREGVRDALRIAGSVHRDVLAERELVIAVDGRVAIDLELVGDLASEASRIEWLRKRVRGLRTSWRVGRLRTTLPIVADKLVARVDHDLESVPPLDELTTRQLIALIGRGREALRSLHAHEVLMGLVADRSSRFTGASVALRILAEGRLDGMSDDEIIRRAPAVLALVPPRVGTRLELPDASTAGALAYDPPAAPDSQVRREAVRIRIRWMQELVGQASVEIGGRLVRREQIPRAGLVRHLSFEELANVVARRADPAVETLEATECEFGDVVALPARFRMGDTGRPISVHVVPHVGGGTGAGGGRARGQVTHDLADPPAGSVLVVRTLSPAIAPHLSRLAAIVAETGSVLAHMAILARESGVATVVAHRDALLELPEGTWVTVDGDTGTVEKEGDP